MTVRKHLGTSLSVAVLALGLAAPAAQAQPMNLRAGVQAAPHRATAVDTRDWTPALMSSDSSKAATAAPVSASNGDGVNWSAVGIGSAIVVLLVGAAATGLRARPRRAAAA
jgi:uncharacterized protein YfiM (DUF2279 family)